MEVFIIMQKVPISWGPIIVLETIKNTSMLYSRVTEHEAALVQAARQESSNVLTAENVVPVLRRMGYYLDRQKDTIDRRAHLTTTPHRDSVTIPEKGAYISQLDESNPDSANPSEVLKEVYQTLAVRQRPPPKGGYPYPKNDHVTTKMGRLPPSPCKTCGSKNHWDKECPDWTMAQTKRERSGMSVEVEAEAELLYQSAFSVLVSERIASEQVDLHKLDQVDFELAALLTLTNLGAECKTVREQVVPQAQRVTVEEIEDEALIEFRNSLKSLTHIIEEIESVKLKAPIPKEREEVFQETRTREEKPKKISVEEIEDEFWHEYYRMPKSATHILEDNLPEPCEVKESLFVYEEEEFTPENLSNTENFHPQNADLPPPLPEPPPTDEPVRLFKRRVRPDGMSAVGVSVLAVKGWVGSKSNSEIDLRLDSCADITLLSEEYYNTLKDKPTLKSGMKLKLWQLTDKDASIKGYVKLPITMLGRNGEMLETEAEAYVVPGMTVPILLGEDFQLTYEIGVKRNVEEGTTISFGRTDYEVEARGVECTNDFDRLRQSAMLTGHFIKAKLHRRSKAKCRLRKTKFGIDQSLIRASEDYKLRPHECKPIRVDGNFDEDRDWLVEKNLLANANDSFFAVPNVLISAKNPWVPVTNPSDHPRYIRKGEIIGSIRDPQDFFDAPRNEDEWEKWVASADVIEKLISIQSRQRMAVTQFRKRKNTVQRQLLCLTLQFTHHQSWSN